jgi:hypothetical protein
MVVPGRLFHPGHHAEGLASPDLDLALQPTAEEQQRLPYPTVRLFLAHFERPMVVAVIAVGHRLVALVVPGV